MAKQENAIMKMLAKMQEKVENRLFSREESEVMDYNKSRIEELTSALVSFKTEQLGKVSTGVWKELAYGYTVGSILGFLREAFIVRTHRKEICDLLGINEELVDYYYQFAGNAPYVKDGMVVEARPADTKNLKKLVYEAAIQMKIVLEDKDLEAINETNEARRNELQLQRQQDYLNNNNKVSQKVNINNFFNA